MLQEVVDRWLTLHRFKHHITFIIFTDVHAQFGKLGNMFGQWVGQRILAFLVEHHHGDTHDRLGHRIHSEQGLGCDRNVFLDICQSQVLIHDDLAATGNQNLKAATLLVVHQSLEITPEICQALRGHRNVFRA